jgi:hypothetical protein
MAVMIGENREIMFGGIGQRVNHRRKSGYWVPRTPSALGIALQRVRSAVSDLSFCEYHENGSCCECATSSRASERRHTNVRTFFHH